MTEISDFIFDYRNCLKNLWNQYFVIDSDEKPDFKFEVDKSFSLIDEGLFNSLVIAKTFDFQIQRTNHEYFDQIMVTPKPDESKALFAKSTGLTNNWQDMLVVSKDSVFKYMELFDWSSDGKKNWGLVRTRLTKSETLKDLIGYDFLFDATEVRYYKIEN